MSPGWLTTRPAAVVVAPFVVLAGLVLGAGATPAAVDAVDADGADRGTVEGVPAMLEVVNGTVSMEKVVEVADLGELPPAQPATTTAVIKTMTNPRPVADPNMHASQRTLVSSRTRAPRPQLGGDAMTAVAGGPAYGA